MPRIARARRSVLVALVVLVVTGLPAMLDGLGGRGDGGEHPSRPEPVFSVAHVARPGDTLWSIARRIEPDGDVRPIVDGLAADRHGAVLQPGDVVVWPLE